MKDASSGPSSLVTERVGPDEYQYYPLGKHVVSAPGICGGRPTIKYTRIEVAGILRLLGSGWTVDAIVADYGRPEVSPEAIAEAASLAAEALVTEAPALQARAA